MKKTTKKTTIVLIGLLTISLIAGNVLFASGLVNSDDAAFVSAGGSAGSGADNSRKYEASSGWIPDADLAFVSEPFNGTLVSSTQADPGTSRSFISASDDSFVRNGAAGSGLSNLVCVVDGVQITGKACVN